WEGAKCTISRESAYAAPHGLPATIPVPSGTFSSARSGKFSTAANRWDGALTSTSPSATMTLAADSPAQPRTPASSSAVQRPATYRASAIPRAVDRLEPIRELAFDRVASQPPRSPPRPEPSLTPARPSASRRPSLQQKVPAPTEEMEQSDRDVRRQTPP